jgi:hypothetical protein
MLTCAAPQGLTYPSLDRSSHYFVTQAEREALKHLTGQYQELTWDQCLYEDWEYYDGCLCRAGPLEAVGGPKGQGEEEGEGGSVWGEEEGDGEADGFSKFTVNDFVFAFAEKMSDRVTDWLDDSERMRGNPALWRAREDIQKGFYVARDSRQYVRL